MRVSFAHDVVEEDVTRFAELSGDWNPLHVDAAHARTTELGRPIVHGMFIGALFSRLVGMFLPGRYALYLSQTLDFARACHVGEHLEITGQVLSLHPSTATVVIQTQASRDGEAIVRGKATVRVLR
jgi:acyl dehydratase